MRTRLRQAARAGTRVPDIVTAAVVLAAGASTRMGSPKAALPLGAAPATVLSRGVAALLSAGVSRVVVVAGAYPDAIRQALVTPDARVTVVDNPAWHEGQLSSLLCGLETVAHPALEAVLVTLADVPLVAPATIRRLIETWRETGAPIVRPARGETHGHPVLFDRRVFGELRAADPTRGAKPVVRAHAHEIVNVAVDDEGAFLDLDTPEDYARALALVARLSIE
jgi:CTP:molybdopterin cytidylyltransferase MocA